MASDIDEQLIQQVVFNETGLDKALGSVMSSVWSAGRQDSFLQSLSTFSKNKEREIEAICSDNHAHFVKSVEDLYNVRAAVTRLKDRSVSLSEELTSSGRLIYDTRQEILEAQKMLHNLSKAELGIQECLLALNLAQTAKLNIDDRSYADALRHIDELERTQLRLVEGYGFAEKLRTWIPVQVGKVREQACKNLQEWLAQVRDRSEILGKKAMKERASSGSLSDIDFGGLLSSMHLFELMGCRKDFLALLCEGRRQQLAILLDIQAISSKDTELNSFADLLENLSGFFLVEYYLTLLPQAVYTMPFVEMQWDQAVRKIKTAIDEATTISLPSPQQQQHYLLKLKNTLIRFLGACQACPLPSVHLSEAIDALFYRFVELLKDQLVTSLEENISGDPLDLLEVSSSELFNQLRSSFNFLREPRFDDAKVFPFTMSVVDLYQTITKFVELLQSFLEGIKQRTGELSDIARKAVDSYLLCEANRLLLERAEGCTDIRQLFAIYLNFAALELIASDIAILLSTRPLQAVSMFAESKVKALNIVQIRLQSQISVFSTAYMSLPRMPESKPTGASKPALDIVAFVSQTRSLFGDNLDKSSFDLIFGIIFKSIADGIIGVLTDLSLPSMNLEYIQAVESDLEFLLEAFCHHTLDLHAFDTLQELIRLALTKSCHEFMDPIMRQKTYANLSSELVASFLEKVSPKAQTKRSSIEDLIALLGRQTL